MEKEWTSPKSWKEEDEVVWVMKEAHDNHLDLNAHSSGAGELSAVVK